MQFKNLLIILLISTAISSYGQLDCFEYYRECKEYNGKKYQYDDNTASFILTTDKQAKIEFEAYQGIEYEITICSENFSLPLNFTIEDENGSVLFDNKQDNYVQSFAFSVKETHDLKVITKIDHDCVENITVCSGCVGILIKKTIKPRTGF